MSTSSLVAGRLSAVRAVLGLSMVGIAMVCAGCGEPSQADLERDAYPFVPPNGYLEGFESHIEQGEVDDRRVADVTMYTRGTKQQRLAAYVDAARGRGWTCVDDACSKSGVPANLLPRGRAAGEQRGDLRRDRAVRALVRGLVAGHLGFGGRAPRPPSCPCLS